MNSNLSNYGGLIGFSTKSNESDAGVHGFVDPCWQRLRKQMMPPGKLKLGIITVLNQFLTK